MPQYKLIFQDASWQDRKFISLTKTLDDGTSQILHCLINKYDDAQVSFGSYAASFKTKQLEFTPEQTTEMDLNMGENVADEASFSRLLGEDILARLLQDKDFLDFNENGARRGNHQVLINAAKDLKQGKCAGIITPGIFPIDYRQRVTRHYMEYILGCNSMLVNAHPDGLFTEIVSATCPLDDNANLNDLNISRHIATLIATKMRSLVTSEFPPYPVIFQYRFLGQPVEHEGNGRYLEITHPTAEQIQTVDSLFDLAARNGFFPTDPQNIIRKAWRNNCAKISKSSQQDRPVICRNGLTIDEINNLLTTASRKESLALLTESQLLKGEYWFAVKTAEQYLVDVDLSQNLSSLDKKVCKLLMHAYLRDILPHRSKATELAEKMINYIDENNYESNLVYAEACLNEGRPEEAIARANKFLALERDPETRHIKYIVLEHYYNEVTQSESPQQDWFYLRAKHVLASSCKDLGDVEQARIHAEDAIRKYREMHYVPSQPLNIMAWVHSQKGNHAEALKCVTESWSSDNSESIRIAIESFTALGEVNKAIEWGETFLAKDDFKNNQEISQALLSAYQVNPSWYDQKAKQLREKMNAASVTGISYFATGKNGADVTQNQPATLKPR